MFVCSFIFGLFLHGVFFLDLTMFESLLKTILSNMTSNVFYFIFNTI